MIDKFFNGDLKVQIMKYCKKLESISQEYDILIFMARKSICFYDALILNGEVKKLDAELVITTSSRILSYDCEFLREKKIALIDDIVIKGNTLYDTINFLLEKEINNFDVYYIASQSFENDNIKLIGRYLREPIIELDSNEILVLGNAITSYISASACSYNVDYPVFYTDKENGFFESYIEKNNCSSIPSCTIEDNTNIYVQNFDCEKYFEQFDLPELEILKQKKNEIIIKFRIFYRTNAEKRKIVVIPIIVLPELSQDEIKSIFKSISSTHLFEMVKNNNANKEACNMLNVIQYVLSYQLFVSMFQNKKEFEFKYSISNQNYIFPQSYNENIIESLNACGCVSNENIKDIVVVDDFFELAEIYRYFFDFIGGWHKKDEGHKIKFSLKEVLEYCLLYYKGNSDNLIANISILFDYAIDTGLIVPEISVRCGKYIRAYRLSEQYELQEKEFDLIIFMYNEYQKKSKKTEMGKILTEKLLVLFFNEVITKILNEHRSHNNGEKAKNLFGIAYARFGPVVSDSSTKIGVSKDTYLTKRLFDSSRSPFKRLYTIENKSINAKNNEEKIYGKETSEDIFRDLPEDWKRKTRLFVTRYCEFERILSFYNVFESSNYIKSFDKFLIISAIGSSKDNQLLSLAAELKIYKNVITSKRTIDDIITAIDSVMDGVINGIWKYICYKTDEYYKCYIISAQKLCEEKRRMEQCCRTIDILRDFIDKLKKIEQSSLDNLKNDVNMYLKIYAIYFNLNRNDEKYKICVAKFNDTYFDPILCKKVLSTSATELKMEIYERIDKLCRRREEVEPENLDHDKLDNLFAEYSNNANRNQEIIDVVEKLMDEAAIILYEISLYWNYIIDAVKNKEIKVKISNIDKNANYLKKVYEILGDNDELHDRVKGINSKKMELEEVIIRLRELEYEVDLLLFCINQYILRNNSKFIPIKSFFVVKRDDENAIEISEIIEAKNREIPLNMYLGFENVKNIAAFSKSNQSLQYIEKLREYTGYTLVDYECMHGCNIIIKQGEQCYSERVKGAIKEVLEQYSDKIIEIRDRR